MRYSVKAVWRNALPLRTMHVVNCDCHSHVIAESCDLCHSLLSEEFGQKTFLPTYTIWCQECGAEFEGILIAVRDQQL